MIILSSRDWSKIRKRLKEEYAWKPSVMMIREVMRRELGFTPRYHKTYQEQTGYVETVHLDFFDPKMESFFMLKYMNHDRHNA